MADYASMTQDRQMVPRVAEAMPAVDPGITAEEACRWFTDAEDATQEAREESERDRDYYDNHQWTRAEIEALKKRKQPVITINRIQRKVDYLLGVEMKQRTDPKAYPRTPHEEEAANAATDGLRYVADEQRFNQTRSGVWKNMMIEGFGGAEVGVERDPRGRYRVTVKRIPWDRLWYDAHSRAEDFSDARHLGMVVWMDIDEAKETYPGREEILTATLDSGTPGQTYDDRPRYAIWADAKRRRVRVISAYYRRGGVWWFCTFTKGGFLVDPAPSPYLDEYGQPECPLILRAAYVDRENRRYGLVRSMISLNDEINKRRSKALHLLSVRQTKGEQGAVEDINKMKAELAKPDGHVETVPGLDWEILPTGDMATAQFSLLQHATAEMDLAGPNAAMAGKDPRQQSGRAILAQQQGGFVELEMLADGLRQWSREVYEAIWHRIRQFWTEETWIRVTDEEEKLRWVGFNVPVTLGERIGQMPPDQQAMMMQRYGIVPGDPRLNMVVETQNQAAEIDVDILIEEGPDVVTLQSETFESLSNLAQAGVQIPLEMLVEAAPLRNKQKLLERMKEDQEKQAQAQQQMAERAMQMQQAETQANIGKTQADTVDKMASAQQRQADAETKLAAERRQTAETQARIIQALRPQPVVVQSGQPGF